MIEKLNEYKITNRDGDFINVECNTKIINTLVRKINNLVDAVNEIMTWRFETDEDSDWYDDPKHREQPADNSEKANCQENVQDKFAEQRKWIGYLCWFWDDDYDLKTVGVLEEITTIEEEFHYAKKDTCTVWKHCEPVLPTDNAIYKGGDNDSPAN